MELLNFVLGVIVGALGCGVLIVGYCVWAEATDFGRRE